MGIQVTELTSGRMPWEKEYIDFSFNGHHISEYGLAAASSSDRYSFDGSPEFEDETTEVNGVSGQYYWGTKFKTKTYQFSLATDGMTERQFEEFKRLFRPGHYGQFYEDTWFDRYCFARVKSVTDFSFVPFQEEVKVAGVKFKSRIYKGECTLTLIQDRPFMYSFQQVLDTKIQDMGTSNDNGAAAARMMYHNNIPARDSWIKGNKCATGSWFSLPGVKKVQKQQTISSGTTTVEVEEEQEDTTNLFKQTSSFCYYNPSSFSSEANIEFTIKRSTTPVNHLEWEPVYFNEIYDDITNPYTPYNTISTTSSISAESSVEAVTGNYTNHFKYSLPEVSADINKAIETAWRFYQENPQGALIDLQERLQEELINSRVLLWAIKVLQRIQVNPIFYIPDGTRAIEVYGTEENVPGCFKLDKTIAYCEPVSKIPMEVDWFGYFNLMMLMMFGECSLYEQNDILTKGIFTDFYPYTLKFLGDKGQSFTTYTCNFLGADGVISQEKILDENCSNVVASGYLKVDGGDKINTTTGKVASYHVIGFFHGVSEPIVVDDIKLDYKYTYA